MHSHRLDIYLDQVMAYADLTAEEAQWKRAELTDHLLERVSELEAAGSTRDDAVFRAIHDHGPPRRVGYGLRTGTRWIDVRLYGTARGFIAIGPRAVGCVACGGVATGVIAFGGVTLGLLSCGFFSAAGFALGIISCGIISLGLNSLGAVAIGTNTLGIVTKGVNAIGLWAASGNDQYSYYDADTVPAVLRSTGLLIDWNGHDMWFGLFLPTFLFVALLLYAAWRAVQESRRLKQSSPWLYE